ncbi:hypothetical protein B5E58_02320 [Tyzzerella sp. An114]|uniref:lysine exporter LysO family protein n=1 Tax=Tyzzerella sp. An114 TaxID=1965545 RepID=UPI000B445379|nr:lysine exporter LysO family protein [Tyzzerella sp. An114]OUQ59945.1 hypothetical protein B5E58_02320 [Tyzzerella sp. An114]
MIIIALISLVAGVLCGQFVFDVNVINMFSHISDYALYILMFAVGISVGTNKQVFRKLKEYHVKIIIIPFGIIIGSIFGGIVCSIVLKMPLNESLSIASGLGWYSLSGVLLTNLGGAQLGTLAFLSNIMRELFSFLSIPFVAKHFNKYTAIAPAAATSEDTTLPMLIKYTSADVAVMAVINGVICSAVVPILINFFFNLF